MGPFFFKTSQAPVYPLGVGMMLFCIGIQVLCLVGIGVLLWSRNRSRRAFHNNVQENGGHAEGIERALMDETDLQNKYFQVGVSFGYDA